MATASPAPELEQTHCDKCGTELKPRAAYCENCGERTRRARRLVRLAVRVEVLVIVLVILLIAAFVVVYSIQK